MDPEYTYTYPVPPLPSGARAPFRSFRVANLPVLCRRRARERLNGAGVRRSAVAGVRAWASFQASLRRVGRQLACDAALQLRASLGLRRSISGIRDLVHTLALFNANKSCYCCSQPLWFLW